MFILIGRDRPHAVLNLPEKIWIKSPRYNWNLIGCKFVRAINAIKKQNCQSTLDDEKKMTEWQTKNPSI